MGIIDAECNACRAAIRWLIGTSRLCRSCRAAGRTETAPQPVSWGVPKWDSKLADEFFARIHAPAPMSAWVEGLEADLASL